MIVRLMLCILRIQPLLLRLMLMRERLQPTPSRLQSVPTRLQLRSHRLSGPSPRIKLVSIRMERVLASLIPVLLRQRLASESKNATVNSKPETGTEAEARYARADTGAADSL